MKKLTGNKFRKTVHSALSSDKLLRNLENEHIKDVCVWDVLRSKHIDVRFSGDGKSVYAGTLFGLLFYVCECARELVPADEWPREQGEVAKDNEEFIKSFLLLHDWFADSATLLKHLGDIYDIPEEVVVENIPIMKPQRSKWVSKEQVKGCVKIVVDIWAETEWKSVEQNRVLRAQFEQRFPSCVLSSETLSSQSSIKANVLDTERETNLKKKFSKGTAIKSLRFFDRSPAVVALHLTALEFDHFKRISLLEFKDNAWTSKTKYESSPAIMEMIRFFNKLSLWAVGMILDKTTELERAEVVEKIIEVIDELMELNNFNTSMALYSALTVNAIHRLQATFAKVKRNRMKQLHRFDEFFSANTNFQTYRSMVGNENMFCIPFLGLHLRDMVYVNDSAMTIFPTLANMPLTDKETRRKHSSKKTVPYQPFIDRIYNYVNMRKLSSLCSVIKLLRHYQNTPLPQPLLSSVEPQLLSLIRLFIYPRYDDETLYSLSLAREPKIGVDCKDKPRPAARTISSDGQLKKERRRPSLSKLMSVFKSLNIFSTPKDKGSTSRINRMQSGFGEGWVSRIYTPDSRETEQERDDAFTVMVDTILDLYDSNSNGELSIDEFRELSSNFPCIGTFSMIDTNGDGIITRDELLDYFQKIDHTHVQEGAEDHNFLPLKISSDEQMEKCDQCNEALNPSSSEAERDHSSSNEVILCTGCHFRSHRRCQNSIAISCTDFRGLTQRTLSSTNQRSELGKNCSNQEPLVEETDLTAVSCQ